MRLVRLLLLVSVLLPALAACGTGNPLTSVSMSPTVIAPNGHSDNGLANLSYFLTRRVDVTVAFTGPDGAHRVLRDARTRAPGQYTIQFDGTYNGSVLPDGLYQWQIIASDPATRATLGEKTAELRIRDADTVHPQIERPNVFPNPFHPNGNLATDTATFTYVLSKAAEVTIYAVGPRGSDKAQRYDVLYQDPEKPGPNQATWTGQIGPEDFVPDGVYQWTIQAKDAAGNVTEQQGTVSVTDSGIPDARIEDVHATEVDKPDGRYIEVQVRLYNSGKATLYGDTQPGAPQDGFIYGSLSANYLMPPPFGPNWGEQAIGRAGTYTVGVSYFERDNAPNQVPLPFRWSIGAPPLQPRQERVITGYIKVPASFHGQVSIYAGIVHEGQGILSGQFQIPAVPVLNMS